MGNTALSSQEDPLNICGKPKTAVSFSECPKPHSVSEGWDQVILKPNVKVLFENVDPECLGQVS